MSDIMSVIWFQSFGISDQGFCLILDNHKLSSKRNSDMASGLVKLVMISSTLVICSG